jgi:hypothetical protein
MLGGIWPFLQDPANLGVLGSIGAAIAAIAAVAWAVFSFFAKRRLLPRADSSSRPWQPHPESLESPSEYYDNGDGGKPYSPKPSVPSRQYYQENAEPISPDYYEEPLRLPDVQRPEQTRIIDANLLAEHFVPGEFALLTIVIRARES